MQRWINITKKIYLCGPILSRTTEEANHWRHQAINELQNITHVEETGNLKETPLQERYKFQCLDPMRRQFSDKDMLGMNEIVQMDKEDVKDADIILVNYNTARQKTTLCGTAMEIYLAWTLGKYIVCFTDLPKEEWSPWMIYHSTRICKSFTEAITYIKKHF